MDWQNICEKQYTDTQNNRLSLSPVLLCNLVHNTTNDNWNFLLSLEQLYYKQHCRSNILHFCTLGSGLDVKIAHFFCCSLASITMYVNQAGDEHVPARGYIWDHQLISCRLLNRWFIFVPKKIMWIWTVDTSVKESVYIFQSHSSFHLWKF